MIFDRGTAGAGYTSHYKPLQRMKTDEARVFFVTTSSEDNEELHETREKAIEYFNEHLQGRAGASITMCMVRNAYREENGEWNYDDRSDTFEVIRAVR